MEGLCPDGTLDSQR